MAKDFTTAKRGMVAVVEQVHSYTGAGFKRETWSDYTIVRVTNIFRDGHVKRAESFTGTAFESWKPGWGNWTRLWVINNVQWADIEPALKKRRGGGTFNDFDSCKEWLRKYKR